MWPCLVARLWTLRSHTLNVGQKVRRVTLAIACSDVGDSDTGHAGVRSLQFQGKRLLQTTRDRVREGRDELKKELALLQAEKKGNIFQKCET